MAPTRLSVETKPSIPNPNLCSHLVWEYMKLTTTPNNEAILVKRAKTKVPRTGKRFSGGVCSNLAANARTMAEKQNCSARAIAHERLFNLQNMEE